MSEPTLNVELLDATLRFVTDHPDEHAQATWRCETTMCFAGHTVTLAGKDNWMFPAFARFSNLLAPLPEDEGIVGHYDYGGDSFDFVTAYDRAQRLLGLTYEEANALFYCMGDVSSLTECVKLIKDGWYRSDEYFASLEEDEEY